MGAFHGYEYAGIIQDQARIDELNAYAKSKGQSYYDGNSLKPEEAPTGVTPQILLCDIFPQCPNSVSYTHLDVYKRQLAHSSIRIFTKQ